MDKLEKLMHIKQAALYVEPQLIGSDFDRVRAAEEEWLRLVDQLYEGNGHIITERQYQAARTQFEYFMVLLEMTIDHYRREAREESKK
jgi:hypothetical protein